MMELFDHEKAEKYDDLQLPFSHRVYIVKLEQENKKLKEIVEQIKGAVIDWPADSYCDIDAPEDCARAVREIREILNN